MIAGGEPGRVDQRNEHFQMVILRRLLAEGSFSTTVSPPWLLIKLSRCVFCRGRQEEPGTFYRPAFFPQLIVSFTALTDFFYSCFSHSI